MRKEREQWTKRRECVYLVATLDNKTGTENGKYNHRIIINFAG
jgi:hypothetical protein